MYAQYKKKNKVATHAQQELELQSLINNEPLNIQADAPPDLARKFLAIVSGAGKRKEVMIAQGQEHDASEFNDDILREILSKMGLILPELPADVPPIHQPALKEYGKKASLLNLIYLALAFKRIFDGYCPDLIYILTNHDDRLKEKISNLRLKMSWSVFSKAGQAHIA